MENVWLSTNNKLSQNNIIQYQRVLIQEWQIDEICLNICK